MLCWLTLTTLTLMAGVPAVQACGNYWISVEVLRALAGDSDTPLEMDMLRRAGQESIDVMSGIRQQLAATRAKLQAVPEPIKETASEIDALTRRIAKLDELMDQVGMQKYCSRSRLFWHTDLEEAKTAARANGKPILSLRMLGNLNEEFSCANSRFFRTTLYANDEISRALRENFVLHWKSVRPVPKVTIDFGDGRKLERTLTGNSIHYILTPDGDVVEALPGLYGPKAFLRKLSELSSLARRVAALSPSARNEAIVAHHARRFAELGAEFNGDLRKIAAARTEIERIARTGALKGGAEAAPAQPEATKVEAAVAAGALARPKMRVERPLLAAALPAAVNPDELMDENLWQAIAALHAEDAQLDTASRELIRSENPTAAVAGRLAITKSIVEDPLVRLVRSLENSIALDTVRNEYQLHRRIHQWLAEASYRPDVETLNERVYAEVFLTPSSDPWLGLAPPTVYTALPNGGVVATKK
jgi:hypothetical protein